MSAVIKTCPHCGKEFEVGRFNQVYCSYRCQQNAASARYYKKIKHDRANYNFRAKAAAKGLYWDGTC